MELSVDETTETDRWRAGCNAVTRKLWPHCSQHRDASGEWSVFAWTAAYGDESI